MAKSSPGNRRRGRSGGAKSPSEVRLLLNSMQKTLSMAKAESDLWAGVMEVGKEWSDEPTAEQERMPVACGIPAVGGASKISTGQSRGDTAITRFLNQAKGLDGAMKRVKKQTELISGGGNSMNPSSDPAVSNVRKACISTTEIIKSNTARGGTST